jgi:nicotinamidase-related amidase
MKQREESAALVITDPQNDFLSPKGATLAGANSRKSSGRCSLSGWMAW